MCKKLPRGDGTVHTNNAYFKLMDTLLQIHSCFFSFFHTV